MLVETISVGWKNYLDWKSFKHHSSVIIYQIDLHGYTFEEAESKLENWLIEEYNKHNFPYPKVCDDDIELPEQDKPVPKCKQPPIPNFLDIYKFNFFGFLANPRHY